MIGTIRATRAASAGVLALLVAAACSAAADGLRAGGAASAAAPTFEIERVTTAVPYPRGLVMLGDDLLVLSRGRVRGAGGVTAAIDDRAGTLFLVDPGCTEPANAAPIGHAIRTNGRVLAEPQSPPFRLWDRSAAPPESDRATDRPYCTLRHDPRTGNLFICAFSGIDLPWTPDDPVAFSKNHSDAVLRFDLAAQRWHEVARRDAGGLLDGPDNCLVVGRWLYIATKESSRLLRCDLDAVATTEGPIDVEEIMDAVAPLEGVGPVLLEGQSALAARDGWLYIAYRTSSVIVRIPLDEDGSPAAPLTAQLVAHFDPCDPATGRSADLTDMVFDDAGRLIVVSAQPARLHRFTPDPAQVYDGRREAGEPWCDLAGLLGNAAMKSENVLHHDGWTYVTSGDGYGWQSGADGTVYRLRERVQASGVQSSEMSDASIR